MGVAGTMRLLDRFFAVARGPSPRHHGAEGQVPFNASTLRTIIQGESAVDLPALQLNTRAEVRAFLRAYGYDPEHEEQVAEARAIVARATSILRHHIMRPHEAMPREIEAVKDPVPLVLWASGVDLEGGAVARPLQLWACALLRVCHTLSHAWSEVNEAHGPAIRSQIVSRFEAHVHADRERGQIFLGTGPDRVALRDFFVRPTKTVEAATLKLLRAVENVAAGIFDWVGVRFVVETPIDALLTIRYLRAHHVISYPNLIPGRGRNSLFDWAEIEGWLARHESSSLTLAEQVGALRQLSARNASATSGARNHRDHNEHSSDDYRAIQFTCREMVRLPMGSGGSSARFFFPYEVQILDAVSHAASASGPASHEAYKHRQWLAVRRRVLAGISLEDVEA